MKSIGGYFELEMSNNVEYHSNALSLNLGRTAFEFILNLRNYKKVYVPYFICDVLLRSINKLRIEFEFYNINDVLEPVFDFHRIKEGEGFLYINYFGIKNETVNLLSKMIWKNLIIDNAQSFFSMPIDKIDTFYSPRKFFGIPDGAYAYCEGVNRIEFFKDSSFNRFIHLLKRIDLSPEDGFEDFKKSELNLDDLPVMEISAISKKLLKSIEYDRVKDIRRRNFDIISHELNSINRLKISIDQNDIPMTYPFWPEKIGLRDYLQKNRIYMAQYWPNVLELCSSDSLESKLTKELLHIPIDQRYSEKEMNYILKLIRNG